MTHTSTEQPREKCTACNETGTGKDGWDCLHCSGDGWVFAAPAQPDAAPVSTEQPEALRLTEQLEQFHAFPALAASAAAELRRLHAENEELKTQTAHMADLVELADYATKKLEASQAQRAPLSDEDKHRLVIEWSYSSESTGSDFLDGVNYAEKAHGITQEQG